MAVVNISLEIYNLALMILILIFCLATENNNDKLNKTFEMMIICNLTLIVSDILTWTVPSSDWKYALFMTKCANFVLFFAGYVLLLLYSLYLYEYIYGTHQKVGFYIITVICTLLMAMTIVSVFNKMFFYYDNNCVYHRGGFFWISQALPVVIMMFDLMVTITNYKKMSMHETIAFVLYPLLPLGATITMIFLYGITLLYEATTIAIIIVFVSVQLEKEHILREQKSKLKEMKTEIMLSQIKPHFLYNALEGIGDLCITNPEAAEKAVTDFSKYLRGNIDSIETTRLIAFTNELEHTKHYLELEKVRFGDRIKIKTDIKVKDFYIPTLTLQPIVENAVRCGVTQRADGGTIEISTSENENEYIITVRDDGVGFDSQTPRDKKHPHIGITNVSRRLKSQCGGQLIITSDVEKGTEATIIIPKGSEVNGL